MHQTIQEMKQALNCWESIFTTSFAVFFQLGGPSMKMKTGRRDSRVSAKVEADDGIPTPQTDVTTVLNYFSKLGINTQHTVALLGT